MSSYAEVKEKAREASALRSLIGREIAPLPPVKDPARRRACSKDLRLFLLTYFPKKYKKPFGRPHLELIRNIERVVLEGGKQAVALPRGSGKTTICMGSCVWALVYGWRRFVVPVAANTKEARKILRAIAASFTSSPTLAEDFPEVCFPLQRLRGSALLARGQLFYGQPVNVVITADSLKLPTIPGSKASGATIASYGIRAAIRGLSAENPDGSTDRPDLLFLDDLQTDGVAINPARVAALEETVAGTLEGLAENGAELDLTLQSLAAAETEAGTYLIVETSLPGGKGTAAILNDYAASIFAAAKGRYEPSLLIEGKYEGIRSKKEKRAVAKAVFAAVDGEVTERVSDGSYLSYSGRSRRIVGGVTSGDHTVNLQVALSENERENATYIYIGSPVVFSDF